MRTGTPEISVIIPAFNEENRLSATLPKIHEYLQGNFTTFEIMVIDDGSTDATRDLAGEFCDQYPEIRLISYGRNRGKGYAVRSGARAAQGKFILFSDADLSTPPEEADKLLAALHAGHDLAIGSRARKESNIIKRQPRYRMLMGKIFNRITRLLVLDGFGDTQCGFKCFRAEAAKDIFARCRINGFSFDVELLFLAKESGFSVREVGIDWLNDEQSKVNPLRHSLQMLVDLARIRLFAVLGYYTAPRGLEMEPEPSGKPAELIPN